MMVMMIIMMVMRMRIIDVMDELKGLKNLIDFPQYPHSGDVDINGENDDDKSLLKMMIMLTTKVF